MNTIEKNMTAILITFFAFFTAGLYEEQKTNNNIEGNTFINPYVSELYYDYIKLIEDNNILIPQQDLILIDMSCTLPNSILAVAWGMYTDNTISVSVNLNTFSYLSDNQKRFLMYHELSHDIFNLEHYSCMIMTTPMPEIVSDEYLNLMINDLIYKLQRYGY